MRLNIKIISCLILLLPMLSLAGAAYADTQSDYSAALKKGLELSESVKSYEINSSLVIENNVTGQTGGMKLEATQTALGQMPDRLFVGIDSPMFKQELGTGPEKSWFFLPGAGVCYVGKPVQLSRELNPDSSLGLSEGVLFNFFSGLGDFIFTEKRTPEAEAPLETLTIGTEEFNCQVFKFIDQDGISTFWFDKKSGLILKAKMVTQMVDQGVEMERSLTTTVSSFALNGALSDDKFQFTAPSEIRVVDSLERVMNPDSMVGLPAPDISFTDLEGKTIELKDLRGKVVFIDFWATWCGPCRMEMPHIEKLFQEFKGNNGLAFLGASNEEKNTVTGFLKKNDYNFPIVLVNAEDARGKFKVTSIPAGFVIDAEGIIRAHMIGTQSEEQLRASFAKAGFKN